MSFYKVRLKFDDGYVEMSEHDTYLDAAKYHGFENGNPALYAGESMIVYRVDDYGRTYILLHEFRYRECVECGECGCGECGECECECPHYIPLSDRDKEIRVAELIR